MSLKTFVQSIWGDKVNVVHSTPAIYAAGDHDIFAITGGPVHIIGIIEYLDTALTAATQTAIDIGAISMDNGLVVIDGGGVDAVVVSPLLAGQAKIDSVLVTAFPTLLGVAAAVHGVVAGPGVTIEWEFGGVAMVEPDRVSLHVIYRKLAPASLIA